MPPIQPSEQDDKLSPKELALLDLQREELKGKFELEKQRAANRGTWIGASIGAIGAILLVLVSHVLSPKRTEESSSQKFVELQNAYTLKIEEWEKYSASLETSLDEANKKIEISNANLTKPPTISLAPFVLTSTNASQCEEIIANIALELNIERVRSSNGFIGRAGETSVLISCAARTIVSSGRNIDKAQNLSRQIRDKIP